MSQHYEPAWEALFAEIKKWSPYPPNVITLGNRVVVKNRLKELRLKALIAAEKLRVETAIGEEFTKKDLRRRSISPSNFLWREMEKRGIVREEARDGGRRGEQWLSQRWKPWHDGWTRWSGRWKGSGGSKCGGSKCHTTL